MFFATWNRSMPMPISSRQFWVARSLKHSIGRLSVRGAQGRTGIAPADFSRIRNADLGRFTIDRLMSIINRLGSRLEVKIKLRRDEAVEDRL